MDDIFEIYGIQGKATPGEVMDMSKRFEVRKQTINEIWLELRWHEGEEWQMNWGCLAQAELYMTL